jgi:hypothetical protein
MLIKQKRKNQQYKPNNSTIFKLASEQHCLLGSLVYPAVQSMRDFQGIYSLQAGHYGSLILPTDPEKHPA